MQQLVKSASSLSWALPLFGLQQAANAFRRSSDGSMGGDAVAAFDAVTQVSIDHCGQSIRQTFEAGDKMQQDIIDLIFRFVPMAGGDMAGMSGMADITNPMQMMRRFMPGEQAGAQTQPTQAMGGEPGSGSTPPVH